MRVGFFFNGFDNPHLVAHSPTIICKDVNMPLHGRITLTGDNTEAVVQWTTHDTAGGIVQLGRRSGKYTSTFDASDMTYDRTDMCGGAAKHVRPLSACMCARSAGDVSCCSAVLLSVLMHASARAHCLANPLAARHAGC